jgi:hypothetical protein
LDDTDVDILHNITLYLKDTEDKVIVRKTAKKCGETSPWLQFQAFVTCAVDGNK